MKLAVVVAIAALGCGSKKNSDEDKKLDSYTRLLAKGAELAEQACNCKDQQCIMQRIEAFAAFVGEQQKAIADKPPADFEGRMRALQQRLETCATKALAPPERVMPAMPKNPLQVGGLVQAARARATALDKRLVLASFVAKYVRADGTLDKQYGALEVAFRMPPLVDDPDRPIGAPPPEPSADNTKTDCPTWTASGGKWQESLGACAPDKAIAPAKCTIEQVWARAIDDKAPSNALATLVLDVEDGKPTWTFEIADKARNIDIRKKYPDDCALQVEKPK